MESKGLIFSGQDETKERMDIIEMSTKDHPFFMGVQYHPEYKSRPAQSIAQRLRFCFEFGGRHRHSLALWRQRATPIRPADPPWHFIPRRTWGRCWRNAVQTAQVRTGRHSGSEWTEWRVVQETGSWGCTGLFGHAHAQCPCSVAWALLHSCPAMERTCWSVLQRHS